MRVAKQAFLRPRVADYAQPDVSTTFRQQMPCQFRRPGRDPISCGRRAPTHRCAGLRKEALTIRASQFATGVAFCKGAAGKGAIGMMWTGSARALDGKGDAWESGGGRPVPLRGDAP